MAADNLDKRVRYFPGQYLLEEDFEHEQNYHRDRLQRINRNLHVSGITSGLKVTLNYDSRSINISQGDAIDKNGHQIVLLKDTSLPFPTDTTDGVKILYFYSKEEVTDLQERADQNNNTGRRWLEKPYFELVPEGGNEPPGAIALARLEVRGDRISRQSEAPNDRQYSGLRLPSSDDVDTLILRASNSAQSLAVLEGSLQVTRGITTFGDSGIVGKLTVNGGVAIGSDYASNPSPPDGLIVKGNVGIGTANPQAKLAINGGLHVGGGSDPGDKNLQVDGTLQVAGTSTLSGKLTVNNQVELKGAAESTGLTVDSAGKVGIGTTTPNSSLSVAGGVAIGSIYATSNAASSGQLLVQERVGIGTMAPVARLDLQDVVRTGTHPTVVKGLYVTGDFDESNGVEFRHTNGTQGIGFGYNTIYAAGSNSTQNLIIKAKGSGIVKITSDLVVGEKNLARPSWSTASWNGQERIETYQNWKKIEALEVGLITCGKPVLVIANLNCRTVKNPNGEVLSNTWGKVTIFRSSAARTSVNLAGEDDNAFLQLYARAPEGQNIPISIAIIDLAPAGTNTYYIACQQMEGSSLIGFTDNGGRRTKCQITVVELV